MVISVILLALGSFSIACAISYYRKHYKKYIDINQLPGPSSLDILRQLLAGGSVDDKYRFISSLNEKYGPVVKIWIKPFPPRIMVADLEYFNRILLSKVHLSKSNLYRKVVSLFGEGLVVTNNNEEWKKNRKICNSAFQHSTMKKMLPIISKYTDILVKILRNQTGNVVETESLIQLYTLDVLFEAITKEGQHFLKKKNFRYIKALSEYVAIIAKRVFSLLLMNDCIFRFTKYYNTEKEVSHFLKTYSRRIVKRKLSEIEYNTPTMPKLHLIEVLLANNMEKDKIEYFVNMFVAGGTYTMGQTMCFILYQLAREPDIQSKIFEEITSVAGEGKNNEITHNSLSEMKYVECVIKEVTRMFTIVPVTDRKLGDDEIIDGISYPKDTTFIFHIDHVHKSEKYFINPNKFDPDRFMPENAHLLHKNSLLTFSLGPRDCVGKPIAMLCMKYFVAKIIQNFILKPDKNHKLQLQYSVSLTTATGLPVIFEERSQD